MKVWATLARYAYRSGEFQVRLPFSCKLRASAAGRSSGIGRFRVEGGTLVFGGGSACRALVVVLDAPDSLHLAGMEMLPPFTMDERRAAWERFKSLLHQEMKAHLHDS